MKGIKIGKHKMMGWEMCDQHWNKEVRRTETVKGAKFEWSEAKVDQRM